VRITEGQKDAGNASGNQIHPERKSGAKSSYGLVRCNWGCEEERTGLSHFRKKSLGRGADETKIPGSREKGWRRRLNPVSQRSKGKKKE